MKKDKKIPDAITDFESPDDSKQDYLWLIGCFAVTGVSVFLRFWQLTIRPLHHDEGVNGFFLKKLFKEGIYQYDPANYHGPDLYYLSLVFSKIFGLTTVSVRASVAIFGVLTVVLTLFLWRHVGQIGALSAALLIAVSPGMVFISRYFIHEIIFVFFSLGIVAGVVFFIEKRRVGMIAVATMTLLLLICFLPTALNLAELISDERVVLKWSLRIGLFGIEAILVFMIMRMLLVWKSGRPIYLLLASASAAMLFATKETAFITIGTMLIAIPCVWIWRNLYRAVFRPPGESDRETVQLTWAVFCERASISSFRQVVFVHGAMISAAIFVFWGGVRVLMPWLTASASDKVQGLAEPWAKTDYGILAFGFIFLLAALAARPRRKSRRIKADFVILSLAACFVFVYVGVLFFSSFFTHPSGISGAFEAYAIWTKTGSADHIQNGFWAYLKWGYQLELPIFILAFVGTLIAFIKGRHRLAMFTGLWAFGLLLAYSIIPYKTPWLALSFLLPMCMIGGYGINELAISRSLAQKAAAAVLAMAAFGMLAFQTYDLNFVRYDDEEMAYVYAHTRRGFNDLMAKIEHYAYKSGKGKEAAVEVVSPEYWPMPWYTMDYKNAVYGGQLKDINTAEMIVTSFKQKDELAKRYAAHYKFAGEFPLRPGVELYLLIREDLAEPDAKELYEIE